MDATKTRTVARVRFATTKHAKQDAAMMQAAISQKVRSATQTTRSVAQAVVKTKIVQTGFATHPNESVYSAKKPATAKIKTPVLCVSTTNAKPAKKTTAPKEKFVDKMGSAWIAKTQTIVPKSKSIAIQVQTPVKLAKTLMTMRSVAKTRSARQTNALLVVAKTPTVPTGNRASTTTANAPNKVTVPVESNSVSTSDVLPAPMKKTITSVDRTNSVSMVLVSKPTAEPPEIVSCWEKPIRFA